MPWNGVDGHPWEDWELDILLGGRAQTPPVPYKTILEQLPPYRTWAGVAQAAYEYGATNLENRATARDKYPTRKGEIFACMQTCALDRKMSQEQAREWLRKVKGIELGRTAFNKRVRDLASSEDKDKREVYAAFKENGKRAAALKISLAKRKEYRSGKSNLIAGGAHHGKDTGSESKGQDQSTA